MELGCRNRAVSTYVKVMTPFGLSKSTLNYVYFTLLPYKIAGTGAGAKANQIYILVYTQKGGNVKKVKKFNANKNKSKLKHLQRMRS